MNWKDRPLLNWKDRDDDYSTARGAREIGGHYVISRRGGDVEWSGRHLPVYFGVRWRESNGNDLWNGVAMTLAEAKQLAQQAHDQAWLAIAPLLKQAKESAEAAHKKAPRQTADFGERIEQAIRELNKDKLDATAGAAASSAQIEKRDGEMTDEEIAKLRRAKAEQIVQNAVDAGYLTKLPGGRIIETSLLTDEHRAELRASEAQPRRH
jgi:hypothetical protein